MFVRHDVFHSVRSSTHNGGSRRKSFQHRNRHVVEVGSVHENVRPVVEPAYLPPRSNSSKLHTAELQTRHQLSATSFQSSATHQIKLRLRIDSLHLRESSNQNIDSVVRMKSPRTNQMRL